MTPAGGWRQPLNGGPTSILTPLLDYIPDGDADVLVVLARVRLRGLAPAPIELRLGRRTRARPLGRISGQTVWNDACRSVAVAGSRDNRYHLSESAMWTSHPLFLLVPRASTHPSS